MEHEVHSHDAVDYVFLSDDGTFPNNSRLPLLKYNAAVQLEDPDHAANFEHIFHANRWVGSWRNGVYAVHHYHSSAHEVLGVYGGTAVVQFGGEQGIAVEVKAGDVVVIPAGVAHKRLRSSMDFRVVGAYPEGQSWDMCYGREGERPETDRNISRVPVPATDPVYGGSGPLREIWTDS
jgi:uncharacterized protein YjlB